MVFPKEGTRLLGNADDVAKMLEDLQVQEVSINPQALSAAYRLRHGAPLAIHAFFAEMYEPLDEKVTDKQYRLEAACSEEVRARQGCSIGSGETLC